MRFLEAQVRLARLGRRKLERPAGYLAHPQSAHELEAGQAAEILRVPFSVVLIGGAPIAFTTAETHWTRCSHWDTPNESGLSANNPRPFRTAAEGRARAASTAPRPAGTDEAGSPPSLATGRIGVCSRRG